MFSNKKIITFLLLIFQLGFFGVVAAQDIAVNISGLRSVTVGSSVTYKVYITNNGPSNATNVIVKAPNAANITETSVTYVTGAGNGGSSTTPTAGSVTLANLQGSSGIVIPSLPSGSVGVFTVVGTASSTVSNISYAANATFSGDSNIANNSFTLTTNVYATASCGSTTTYTLDLARTVANNTAAPNGGTISLYYVRSGPAITGLANPLIIAATYSDLNSYSGIDHRWNTIDVTDAVLNIGMASYNNNLVGQTADAGNVYNSLPSSNLKPSPGYSKPYSGTILNTDRVFSEYLRSGEFISLGTFTLSIGNIPTLPTGVRMTSESVILQGRGTMTNSSLDVDLIASGYLAKPIIQNTVQSDMTANSNKTPEIEMEFGQTYTWRYSAFATSGLPRQSNRRGIAFVSSMITFTTSPATPTITTTAATCSTAGKATISNYVSATYTFSPTGPTVAAGGVISGMTAGTTYIVTATVGGCQSNASDEFSIAASTSLAGTTAPMLITGGSLSYTNSNGVNACKIPCGSITADLTGITASNKPSGTTLTWHNATPATTANKINDVKALVGTTRVYTAFFDSANDCYSPTQTVVIFAPICAADDDFTDTPIIAGIGGTLRSIYANDSYNGITITSMSAITAQWVPELWEFNQIATVNDNGTIVIPPGLAPGIYTNYYKLRDKHPAGTGNINDSEVVTVTFRVVCGAGEVAPPVNATLSNTCPIGTVNLNSAHTGTIPTGATLRWYTSATMAPGTQVANPLGVNVSNTYYAFYYHAAGNCYSPASTAVNVTIVDCCINPPNTAPATDFTKTGISDLVGFVGGATGWPGNVPNGFIAIESKKSGFVITRVQNAGKIVNPVEGMLIYDIDAACIKLYTVLRGWNCLQKDCN